MRPNAKPSVKKIIRQRAAEKTRAAVTTPSASADYSDRADAMRAEQREELKTVLTKKFGQFLARVSAEHDATLEAFNLAREMGAQIELFTGHEKLLPAEFAYIQPALTPGESKLLPVQAGATPGLASLDFAKACLAIHQKFPEPEKNYAVAAPVLDGLLAQLQLLPRPMRKGAEGQPPATGPVLEFISDIIKTAQAAARLNEKMPIEQWEPFNRKSFITQGRPFFDLYERALKLETASAPIPA